MRRAVVPLSAFALTLVTSVSAFACPSAHAEWPASPFSYLGVLGVGVLLGAASRVAERFIG